MFRFADIWRSRSIGQGGLAADLGGDAIFAIEWDLEQIETGTNLPLASTS